MKKLIIITTLFIVSSICNGQDREKKFSLFLYNNPTESFNIGAGVEYHMSIIYVDMQAFVYPDKDGETYYEFNGTVLGFNKHFGFNDEVRVFLGTRLGMVFRGQAPHATAGLETGVDVILVDDFYIGIGTTYDLHTDQTVFGADEPDYWSFNHFIKLGIKFN